MDYPVAPHTHTACSMQQASEYVHHRVMDGDTIRLQWNGVSNHAKLAVESIAIALGLNVIVELPPP